MRAAFLLLSLAGCSVPREEYPEAFAKAACQQLIDCNRTEFETAYDSMDDCHVAWEHTTRDYADAHDGVGEYDAQKGGRCIREIRSATCDEFDNGDYHQTCDDAWAG